MTRSRTRSIVIFCALLGVPTALVALAARQALAQASCPRQIPYDTQCLTDTKECQGTSQSQCQGLTGVVYSRTGKFGCIFNSGYNTSCADGTVQADCKDECSCNWVIQPDMTYKCVKGVCTTSKHVKKDVYGC